MASAERYVFIFYAGDSPEDRDFAQRIADGVRSFCSPRLVNVDELERMDDAGASRPERFCGVPIYVLSPAMLRLPYYRQKLVAGTPSRNLPGRSVFYICCGITAAEIPDQYPDLRPLFFDVMVGDGADLPTMVAELRAYIDCASDRMGFNKRLSLFVKYVAAMVMYPVGTVGYLAYFAAFFTAPWLLFSLLLTSGSAALETVAACHVLYAAGYGINLVRPLDLWPWLGPAWSIGAAPPGVHADSVRSLRSFLDAIGPWQQMADAARMLKFGVLCWLVIPGAAVLGGGKWVWAGTAALLLGLAMPRLWSAALLFLTRRAYWSLGMTDEEMERTDRFFSPWGFGITTELDYRHRATRGGHLVHHPWFRRPPNVFISYAWRDEERTPVAQALQRTISGMGIPCFLDTRRIPGKFASWRARVVDEILDCTHFIVVLGPSVNEAQVMHREVKTALQRWNTELEPAVICVVEPEVAAPLSAEKVRPELEYLLHEAPKITYSEATRGDVIGHLLSQRRRGGLWRDWLAMLRPAARLRQFVENQSLG